MGALCSESHVDVVRIEQIELQIERNDERDDFMALHEQRVRVGVSDGDYHWSWRTDLGNLNLKYLLLVVGT